MKTKILLLLATTLSITGIMAQSDTTDLGVVINGVKWATRNVDNPGTFAATPESAGKFYQWNRKVAWNTTDSIVSGWDSTTPKGTEWKKTNDPSPAGWRVPTCEDINSLLDEAKVNSEWITHNGIIGRQFTDKTTGTSLFLPAAGYRGWHDYSDGMLYADTSGGYWSSTQKGNFTDACSLLFDSVDTEWNYSVERSCGQNIRPVAE